MAPLSESERRDFWEICEDRYQVRSLILTSQLPVTRWQEQIGHPTVQMASSIGRFTMLVASSARRFNAQESRAPRRLGT
jgi:hypothetical protein